jgi:hypothetical protein
MLGCRFDGGVRIWRGEVVETLLDTERSDSISYFCLGFETGRPVLAIGTDSGAVETYDLLPALSLRGRVGTAHSWHSRALSYGAGTTSARSAQSRLMTT